LDETRKAHVYNQYCASMRATGAADREIAHSSTFFRIWREQYGHVKLSEQRTIESKCTVCEDLKVQAGGHSRVLARVLVMIKCVLDAIHRP
jgi:hypothetical protein